MNGDDNERRFQELLRYYDTVVRFICGLGVDTDRARDFAQDVFLRVYEHIDAYRGDAKLAYLQRVARNVVYNAARDAKASKRKAVTVSEDALFDQPAPRGERPDVVLARKELAQRVAAAVDQLDEGQRLCVLYHYFADLPYQEICPILGISLSALKSRLNTAREHLREILGEEPPGWRDLDGPEDES